LYISNNPMYLKNEHAKKSISIIFYYFYNIIVNIFLSLFFDL